MIVLKVLNNNALIAEDDQKREVILLGKGIGFQKVSGDKVSEEKIKKTFAPFEASQQEGFEVLLKNIPPEELEIVRESVDLIEKNLGRQVSENIFVTLTDHLHLAFQRVTEGYTLPNPLKEQIKTFYLKEYETAQLLVEQIRNKYHLQLPDEEISFITMHIVASASDKNNLQETLELTQIVADALEVVENFYPQQIDKRSISYKRLIVHLQFFAQRYLKREFLPASDPELTELMKRKYPEAYRCALAINELFSRKKGKSVGSAELLYLSIHISQLLNKM